ncbi:hypothetical protein [Haloferula sp. BvORR071]|uniref:hypothetical protein n=1 Tax=Haloferula sp. BvORR071 TaxID=1396141 RepID=UPI002240F889|nr:hypothetical protein [Haloferula sp. BvORR071]
MSGTFHSRNTGVAHRLQGPLAQVLNHLCLLGEGTLILREEGLSLAKVTSFGLCVTDGRQGWHLLRDAISGLETDLCSARNAYLLPDPDDGVPVFATAGISGEVDLSLRFESLNWRSRPILGLLDQCQAIPIDPREGRCLGAGAWLDDWKTSSTLTQTTDWNLLSALDACRCLELEIHSGLHRCAVAFRPAFLDTDGSVIRIADASRKHVVFADAGSAELHFQSLAPGHLKICRESRRQAVRLSAPAA